MNLKNNIKYSVVIPVFNEAENLEVLYARLTKVMDSLDGPHEIIFVDDGSSDSSFEISVSSLTCYQNFAAGG